MEHGSGRKAVIVGGSVGGLFAATALRAAGWDVGVFEQSPHDLDSRGGGIVLQPPIERAFAFGNVPLPREAAVDSIDRIYVDAHDRIVQRFAMPQTQTAWNVIYTALKRALPAGVVRAGDAFERFEQDGERIVAHFASGHAEAADLLIGADGGRSAVRAQLMPDVRPTYAGYVAWRGLVDERVLPEQVLYLLRERFTFQQGDAHLFLTYLVPGADGAIESVASFGTFGAILGCVAAGMGVAILPKRITTEHVARKELRAHAFDDLDSVTTYLVTSEAAPELPELDTLRAVLGRQAGAALGR
ncbi:hypothetical protein G3N96_38030 [Burkholderia sp. Se-20373]|uniref:FAD binding domain-containing protein n=1 Tax=Burkholderia sp. Se-20373 TaxID=2703898 RepID=UPI001F11C889|nr:LysR substrate-binding domain-containing protein [Burkholderia sp. Se-20373]MBN3751144.1 hypothetical protein [Burkholderia sp. Se-20373]